MNTLVRFTFMTALLTLAAAPAAGGQLKLTIANGRVTIAAKDVTVREILAEWARVGQTVIVNADKVTGPPVTLELTDVPEAQALDSLLRSAAGYVMAPRATGTSGPSVYDRIMILATSRPPVNNGGMGSSALPISRPMPQMPMGMTDDDQDVGPSPGANMFMNGPNGMVPGPGAVPQPTMPGQPQAPLTATRPGQLPAPPPPLTAQPGMANPNPGMGPNSPNQPPPASPYQGAQPGQYQPGTVYTPVPAPQPTRPGNPNTGRGGGD